MAEIHSLLANHVVLLLHQDLVVKRHFLNLQLESEDLFLLFFHGLVALLKFSVQFFDLVVYRCGCRGTVAELRALPVLRIFFCLLLQKLDDVIVRLFPFLSLLLVDFHLLTHELKLLLQDCNLLG